MPFEARQITYVVREPIKPKAMASVVVMYLKGLSAIALKNYIFYKYRKERVTNKYKF